MKWLFLEYTTIKLENGEECCPECHGDKRGKFNEIDEYYRYRPSLCKSCNGRGKVDWIKRLITTKN